MPPQRDVGALIEATDDGSADSGTGTVPLQLELAFERSGYRPVVDLPTTSIFPVSPPIPRFDDEPHNDDGVRMQEVDGELYMNPRAAANYGLLNLERYDENNEVFFLDRAIAQAEWLIEQRIESRGAWYYTYDFDFILGQDYDIPLEAPWYSALAQGKALHLFSDLYDRTGEDRWLTAADWTFASFLNPPSESEPWTVSVTDSGYLHFDEYPLLPVEDSYFTYNGHMSALFGLWYYYRITGSQVAEELFDGASTTMRAYADTELRRPEWWSSYGPRLEEGLRGYHTIHVHQMSTMTAITADADFVRVGDLLLDDYPSPDILPEQALVLAAGRHTGYHLDHTTGERRGSTTFELDEPLTVSTDKRLRIPEVGYAYYVDEGEHRSYWFVEEPDRVALQGPVSAWSYPLPRPATFEAGRTYTGMLFDREYEVAETNELTFDESKAAEVTKRAWINGEPHLFVIVDKAGWWIRSEHLLTDQSA